MKITRIETIPISVPIKPELAIKSGRGGSHVTSPFLIVKVHTDEGIVGLGEASCTPRWSGEDQFTAKHFIDNYFAPQLVGQEIRLNFDWLTLMTAVAGNHFTKAAVEMAMWDLAGKARGVPVHELLMPGEKAREFVTTKWSISGREPPVAAEIARWAMSQGFQKMKVKVGTGNTDDDIRRVAAVREAVGPGVTLGVDANGGWPIVRTALITIRQLRRFDIAFVEQPLPAHDILGMAEVRKECGLPVIADESIYTLEDAENLWQLGAADVFSVYIGKAGGIRAASRIAGFARDRQLATTIGSNLELGIGSAAMTHLAIARSEINVEEYPCDIIGPLFYEDDILKEPLPIRGGEARVHEGRPGLGVELDDEKVEKYRVR